MQPSDDASRRPHYRRIADDLRADITSGKYPEGDRLPSNKDLAKRHSVAGETVRSALRLLRDEGLICPDSTRGMVVTGQRAGTAEHDAGAAPAPLELTDIRDTVERLEANLIQLYGKTGFDYPHEGTTDSEEAPSKAAAHGTRT